MNNAGMQFANDQFYELTGHPHGPIDAIEWFHSIADDDVSIVKEHWAHMLEGRKPDGVQFRLKKTWVNQDGVCSNIWVQSSCYPQVDDNEKVTSEFNETFAVDLAKLLGIMGTLFDISKFKWAESVQRRRIDEALEAKRQQEK